MAYVKNECTQYYLSSGPASTHTIGEQITPCNEIDDVIILNIAWDGAGRTVTLSPSTGWNQITTNTTTTGTSHRVFWKRATAANEALPTLSSGSDGCVCQYIVVYGCPTASTPIGNTANDGLNASNSPNFPSISHSANSQILYLLAIDNIRYLTGITDGLILPQPNSSSQGCTMGGAKAFKPSAGTTGTVTGTLDSGDGWNTLTLELLDNGSGEVPIYFSSDPLPAYPSQSVATDNAWRDALTTAQVDPRDGSSIANSKTFDATAGGVDTVTDQITVTGHGYTTGDVVMFESLAGTLPTSSPQITDGYYAFVHVINANTLKFIPNDNPITTTTVNAVDGYLDVGGTPNYITFSAVGSGTCGLKFSGFMFQGLTETNKIGQASTNHESHRNFYSTPITFSSARDMTEETLKITVNTTGVSIENGQFFIIMIDADGDYKVWKVSEAGNLAGNGVPIKIHPLNETTVYEYQTFDVTTVTHTVIIFKGNSNDGRISAAGVNYGISNAKLQIHCPVVGGRGTIEGKAIDIYRELLLYSEDLSFSNVPSQIQFDTLLQLGDGTSDLTLTDEDIAIAFNPPGDGVTDLSNYTFDTGFRFELTAASIVTFSGMLFKSEAPFDFKENAASSTSATLDVSNCTLSRAGIDMQSGATLTSCKVANGAEAVFDGTDISNSTFLNSTSPNAVIRLNTNDTVSNVSIDVGNADFHFALGPLVDAMTFNNVSLTGTPDVNKGQGLKTSGTVTISSDGSDLTVASPSSEITSSGATYNVTGPSPTLTISCPAGGILEIRDNDDTPDKAADMGTLLQITNPTTGADVDFVHSKAGDDIFLSFFHADYVERNVSFNLTSNNQTFDFNTILELETND